MARTLALVLGIAAVLFSPGCQSKARNRQINPTVQSDLAVNANQVRLRMRSLVDPFAGEIEQARQDRRFRVKSVHKASRNSMED